jgi:hypothetical protein
VIDPSPDCGGRASSPDMTTPRCRSWVCGRGHRLAHPGPGEGGLRDPRCTGRRLVIVETGPDLASSVGVPTCSTPQRDQGPQCGPRHNSPSRHPRRQLFNHHRSGDTAWAPHCESRARVCPSSPGASWAISTLPSRYGSRNAPPTRPQPLGAAPNVPIHSLSGRALPDDLGSWSWLVSRRLPRPSSARTLHHPVGYREHLLL